MSFQALSVNLPAPAIASLHHLGEQTLLLVDSSRAPALSETARMRMLTELISHPRHITEALRVAK